MSETTDVPDELVTRAMAGDRVAVGHVLAIIRPLVVRYCRARLGRERSFASADDVERRREALTTVVRQWVAQL